MSGDSTPTEPPQDLAGEYVLGTLPGPDRREVEQRLLTDPALRAAVDAWEARLLPLTALAPPLDAPQALWQRIEQGASRAPDASLSTAALPKTSARKASPAAPQTGWWNNLALWRGLATGGLAAALLLAVRPDLALRGGVTPQYVVVLVAPGGQAPGWVVQVSSPRDLSLTPLGPTPTPGDRALQFWTKADDWKGPVSLGLVRPGEPLRIRLDNLPALQPNQLFEITLEPPLGSPTGRPTGPIQYIGRAVKLNS